MSAITQPADEVIDPSVPACWLISITHMFSGLRKGGPVTWLDCNWDKVAVLLLLGTSPVQKVGVGAVTIDPTKVRDEQAKAQALDKEVAKVCTGGQQRQALSAQVDNYVSCALLCKTAATRLMCTSRTQLLVSIARKWKLQLKAPHHKMLTMS
jgi:hypothetical protein